jgi:glutaredoxin 3
MPMSNFAPVVIYSTASCPYCIRAKALLAQRGVTAMQDIRVDLDPSEREAMIERTGRRTVPQIFIGGTHVGGCDDLMALDQSGGLVRLLTKA